MNKEKIEVLILLLEELRDTRIERIVSKNPNFDDEDELVESIQSLIYDIEGECLWKEV